MIESTLSSKGNPFGQFLLLPLAVRIFDNNSAKKELPLRMQDSIGI